MYEFCTSRHVFRPFQDLFGYPLVIGEKRAFSDDKWHTTSILGR